MEDMISSPYETMVNAFSHLELVHETVSMRKSAGFFISQAINRIRTRSKGLIPFHSSVRKIPLERLLGHIFMHRFSREVEGRKRGEEDTRSHYRKGVAGDWVNHFNEGHRAYFKKNYGDLLIKLGYERDSHW